MIKKETIQSMHQWAVWFFVGDEKKESSKINTDQISGIYYIAERIFKSYKKRHIPGIYQTILSNASLIYITIAVIAANYIQSYEIKFEYPETTLTLIGTIYTVAILLSIKESKEIEENLYEILEDNTDKIPILKNIVFQRKFDIWFLKITLISSIILLTDIDNKHNITAYILPIVMIGVAYAITSAIKNYEINANFKLEIKYKKEEKEKVIRLRKKTKLLKNRIKKACPKHVKILHMRRVRDTEEEPEIIAILYNKKTKYIMTQWIRGIKCNKIMTMASSEGVKALSYYFYQVIEELNDLIEFFDRRQGRKNEKIISIMPNESFEQKRWIRNSKIYIIDRDGEFIVYEYYIDFKSINPKQKTKMIKKFRTQREVNGYIKKHKREQAVIIEATMIEYFNQYKSFHKNLEKIYPLY